MSQIGGLLNRITEIGGSKHAAKEAGTPPGSKIYSITTRKETGNLLRPLAQYCKANGIKDLAKLTPNQLKDYISSRLGHHIHKGNVIKTFQNELSAIQRLEHALAAHGAAYPKAGVTMRSMSDERAAASKAAQQELPRRAGPENRAYERPQELVAAVKDQTHQLQAQIQMESGCRAEGVGAPAKSVKNPLTTANFTDHKTGKPLGIGKDPITGKDAVPFWTKEKGGKLAYHYMSPETFSRVQAHLEQHGKLESDYKGYLKAVEAAAKETGQFVKYKGNHGLRFNFAQSRYDQAVRARYSDERAKMVVSHEMSHNRVDITETYLK
jgi:hypothetical protein